MMKSSRPLPVKRTVGSHHSANKQTQHNHQHQSQHSKQPQFKQQPKETKTTNNNNTTTTTNNNNTIDTANTDPICDICVQNVPGPEREQIFALGKCDHNVCYVCSARLRAICDQHECPICREKLDNVVFSANRNKLFEKHNLASYMYNEKYKIYFEDETIKLAFDKLLKFECLKCLKHATQSSDDFDKKNTENTTTTTTTTSNVVEFQDVLKLKHHLNFTHKLRLCDLCLNHNKLFPFEYSYYDYTSLRKHMKDGEPNTSHRGHPDCILCHQTFFNQDELLQHMSREHYHCHLCGRHNSTMHIYFQDYSSLRLHFKAEHYLCERGNCKHEQFTSAFDSQIDYQLHIVHVHGGSANAGSREARQQRTITLESAPHRPPPNRNQSNVPPNAALVSTGTLATANASDPRRQIPESIQAQIRQQRLPTRNEFPALGHMGSSSSFTSMPTSQSVTVSTTSSATSSQFPSLPQQQSQAKQNSRMIPLCYRVTAGPSSGRPSFVKSAGGGCGAPEKINEMEFPPLPEQPKSKTAKSKPRQPKVFRPDDNMTLDQLISSSLVLSARNQNKNRPNKTGKSTKQKAIKIQL